MDQARVCAAGAETQLTSWPVSDRTTHELMISYYRILLRVSQRRFVAQAQLQMPKANHTTILIIYQTGEWAKLEPLRAPTFRQSGTLGFDCGSSMAAGLTSDTFGTLLPALIRS
jgi:hypothetical protein